MQIDHRSAASALLLLCGCAFPACAQGAAAPNDGSVLPFPSAPSASVAAQTAAGFQTSASCGDEVICPKMRRMFSSSCWMTSVSAAGYTFGGEIHTPTLSKLADHGISYNTFHTTSICSPTRAALLTGRNPPRVGYGTIAERAVDWDGYTGVIPKTSATMPKVLGAYGYKSAAFGKWHNTPAKQTTAMGPFDLWPTGASASITSMDSSPARHRSGSLVFLRISTRSSLRITRNITSAKISRSTASTGCDGIKRSRPTSHFCCTGRRVPGTDRTKSSRNGPTSTKASSTTAGMRS